MLLQRLAGEEMEKTLRDAGDAEAQKLYEQFLQAALDGTLRAPPAALTPTLQIEEPAGTFAPRAVEHAE